MLSSANVKFFNQHMGLEFEVSFLGVYMGRSKAFHLTAGSLDLYHVDTRLWHKLCPPLVAAGAILIYS